MVMDGTSSRRVIPSQGHFRRNVPFFLALGRMLFFCSRNYGNFGNERRMGIYCQKFYGEKVFCKKGFEGKKEVFSWRVLLI